MKEIWICNILFIYNKYKLYKPVEVQKNTNKLFDSVIKLLETYKISINFFRNYIKVIPIRCTEIIIKLIKLIKLIYIYIKYYIKKWEHYTIKKIKKKVLLYH